MNVLISACLTGICCRYDGTSAGCLLPSELHSRYGLLPFAPKFAPACPHRAIRWNSETARRLHKMPSTSPLFLKRGPAKVLHYISRRIVMLPFSNPKALLADTALSMTAPLLAASPRATVFLPICWHHIMCRFSMKHNCRIVCCFYILCPIIPLDIISFLKRCAVVQRPFSLLLRFRFPCIIMTLSFL